MNTSTYEVENGKPRQIILTLIGLDIMTDYPVLNAHAILWIANGISGALGTSAPRHAAAVKRPGVEPRDLFSRPQGPHPGPLRPIKAHRGLRGPI